MLFLKSTTPEIISLHIPKTAGTSFRNILKDVYGEQQVVRFDINEKGVVKLNEKLFDHKELPSAKVIHGHFSFDALYNMFQLPENLKLITWMRDPVKRVISNFYYLESRLKELLEEEKNDLNILSKMQRTLLEYAHAEVNRNRQSKFLSGSQLTDFNFIGITEYFEDELKRLAGILNWDHLPELLIHNKTGVGAGELSKNIVDEIRQLNMEDEELYNEALQIRNSFIASGH